MKRLHIHVGVKKLEDAVRFYSALFGTGPTKAKTDYAQWKLDNPYVNFAISTRSGKTGVDHLGIQMESESELEEMRARMNQAELGVIEQGETICCYARSDKSWVEDPAGLAWETYRTMEDAQLFSGSDTSAESACCAPEMTGVANATSQQAESCCKA